MKWLFCETPVEGSLSAAYHVVAGISALGKQGEDLAVRWCAVCVTQQSVTISDTDLCLRLYQTYLHHMEGSTYVTHYMVTLCVCMGMGILCCHWQGITVPKC